VNFALTRAGIELKFTKSEIKKGGKMTLGSRIRVARKGKNWRMEDLAQALKLSKSTIFKIENEELKSPLDPHLLIRIAEALDEPDILRHQCRTCPIRRHLVDSYVPELEMARDRGVVFSRLHQEMLAGAAVLEGLVKSCAASQAEGRDPFSTPEYRDALSELLEIRNRWEILEFQLLLDDEQGRP
jgi:transcriptional regulator with XRE-family HTH domain